MKKLLLMGLLLASSAAFAHSPGECVTIDISLGINTSNAVQTDASINKFVQRMNAPGKPGKIWVRTAGTINVSPRLETLPVFYHPGNDAYDKVVERLNLALLFPESKNGVQAVFEYLSCAVE